MITLDTTIAEAFELTLPTGVHSHEWDGWFCVQVPEYWYHTRNLGIVTFRDQMAAMRRKPNRRILYSNALMMGMPETRKMHDRELLLEFLRCIVLDEPSAVLIHKTFSHGLPHDITHAIKKIVNWSARPGGAFRPDIFPGAQEFK